MEEQKTLIDRIVLGGAFATMADGSRNRFAKLLVLDYLASSMHLRPTPRALEADSQEIVKVEDYVESLAQGEKVLQTLQGLAEAIDFVIASLCNPMDGSEESKNLKFPNEPMFVLQQLCHQRRNDAMRFIERLNRMFEGHSKIVNIQESIGVKRLSILATIFLPLSLSTSILSMSTRFKDLHLQLYDFVGVFVILGSLAIVILFLVRVVLKIKSIGLYGEWLSPKGLWAVGGSHGTEKQLARLLSILIPIWYFLVWVVLLVSFVVGMIKDVVTGLKILGFGFVGLLGYFIISVGVFCAYVISYPMRGENSSGTVASYGVGWVS
jgi:CorA-like Mg2+ transporter protein